MGTPLVMTEAAVSEQLGHALWSLSACEVCMLLRKAEARRSSRRSNATRRETGAMLRIAAAFKDNLALLVLEERCVPVHEGFV